MTLDLQNALDGRRLCENTVGLLEEVGLASWQSAGAVDRTEWVSQIRTVTTIVGPYQLQEGSHASYWGQLAMRNCCAWPTTEVRCALGALRARGQRPHEPRRASDGAAVKTRPTRSAV